MNVCVVLRYSRYSSPKKLTKRFSSSVLNAFSTDPCSGWGALTSHAIVKESPKHTSEHDETYMVLEDHLRPNCPVEEASVGRVSQPTVVKCQDALGDGGGTSHIRIYSLFHETMARDFMVCYHVREVGRSLDHGHRPQCLTRKYNYDSWMGSL